MSSNIPYGPSQKLHPAAIYPQKLHPAAIYPQKLHPAAIYPSNYIDIKDHIIEGLVMTAGILGSTFLVKKVKRDMAPSLTTKNALSLTTVVILSCYSIEYLKRYGYIPYKI